MRASWSTMLRVCREVAYGIDSMTAIRHGRQPGVPPYLPPSLFGVAVRPRDAVDRRPPAARL